MIASIAEALWKASFFDLVRPDSESECDSFAKDLSFKVFLTLNIRAVRKTSAVTICQLFIIIHISCAGIFIKFGLNAAKIQNM